MYFRKYFAGNIESNSVTSTIKSISNNANITTYINQTKVLCNAIFETLLEAGISCQYNEENYTVIVDGLPVQFLVTVSSGIAYCHVKGVTGFYFTGNGASVVPFNGLNYRFYITLKGDIDSFLKIFIGTYNSPSVESYGIAIGKGIDLRDEVEIRVINNVSAFKASNSYGFIIKEGNVLADYTSTVSFGFQIANVSALNNSGLEVTLTEAMSQAGRFKLNNCYFGNAALAEDYFYNIGGDIYYAVNNLLLAKCVNA